MLTLLALATAASAAVVADAAAIIQPQLISSLKKNPTANVIITMKEGVDRSIMQAEASGRRLSTRSEKVSLLAATLEANAKASQASVLSLLSATESASDVESFWASNTIYVPNASESLISQLSALSEVEEIHEEHIVEIAPIIEEFSSIISNTTLQWGVEKIAAAEAWSVGVNGTGIIVGSIDTGVRGTHEILKQNYVGAENNGWLDPYDSSAEPKDTNGHGTHTMGTIAGANGFGVAPNAKWLACRGCGSSSCTEKALLACGQYILCPTDTDGKNKDCSKAPHISSNSWGGGANQQWYMSTVKAWRAAGIVPVFAQGNSGPRCGTANSPGDYPNVIGVGATTLEDGLASFSSVGPTKTALRKPDVSAPGKNVASAWIGGDSAYKSISGTSMACPHVAGMVALLLSHNHTLTYDSIYNAITMSATTSVLSAPNKNCGGLQDDVFPNNMFGWGVVHSTNAMDAIGKEPPVITTPAPTPPGDDDVKECFESITGHCVELEQCYGADFGFCVDPCTCD